MAAPPLQGQMVVVQSGFHVALEPVYLPRSAPVVGQPLRYTALGPAGRATDPRPGLIGTGHAWIVDDTGFPKKGRHSVGVARQYCGQVGKQDNCRVAVSLSVATWSSSLPIAYRLYLRRNGRRISSGGERRKCPKRLRFRPNRKSRWIRSERQSQQVWIQALSWLTRRTASTPGFRDGVTELDLQYVVVGVQSSMTVWEPGKQPLPAKPRGRMGRPPRLLPRTADHPPVSEKQLAMSLPATAFREITWREGTDRKLQSRFAAVRVRAAHRDYEKAQPHQEEWLLIEWPRGEAEPTKYWVSTLPLNTKLKALIKMAKHRWIIERDYEEFETRVRTGTL